MAPDPLHTKNPPPARLQKLRQIVIRPNHLAWHPLSQYLFQLGRRPIPQALPASDEHRRADRFNRRQFPEKAAKREVAEFVFRNPIQPVHSVPTTPTSAPALRLS